MIGRSPSSASPALEAPTAHRPRTALPPHLSVYRARLPQSEICADCGHSHGGGRAALRAIARSSSRRPLLARLARWATTLEA